MSDKKARGLVIIVAFILLLAGSFLFFMFDKQGMKKNITSNYVNYNVNDYVEITPVVFNSYGDVYSSINVSKIDLKNMDEDIYKAFINREKEIIDYITAYYNEISLNNSHLPVSTVSSTIKTQINGAILSILYRVDFELDENVFNDNIKSYFITINIDLGTNKVLTKDDMLSKYNYTRKYIADKLFNEDVLIGSGQVVVDKDTNISITKDDIQRKKSEYVERIITEFDNIMEMYIENNSLVLVYNVEELKNVFFDNKFDTEIKVRYLN